MNFDIFEVLDTQPNGSIIVDGENNIVFANKWVCRHLKTSLSELQGLGLESIAEIDDWITLQIQTVREENRMVVLSQKLHRFFIPIKLTEAHISGFDYMQQEVFFAPLKKNENWINISIRDVTAMVVGESQCRDMRDNILDSRKQAEEEVARKGKFLAMISHDIRTPMNGIIGYAGLLDITNLTPKQKTYVDVIKSSGDMLLTLLNEILDYSKLEAGKLKINPSEFLLKEATEEIVRIFRPQTNFKSIGLFVDYSPGLPGKVCVDELRYKQVLTNLLSNAVKFTKTGCIQVFVEFETVNSEEFLIVKVQDTGIGISKEHQGNLFKDYVQFDESSNRALGSGLGLSICAQVCELMGGSIAALSEIGNGSTFEFRVKNMA